MTNGNEPAFLESSHDKSDNTTQLEKELWDEYAKSWGNRKLRESEYPNEDICSRCKGVGTFTKQDGEIGECVKDRQEGDCFHRYLDAEGFGLSVEYILIKSKTQANG